MYKNRMTKQFSKDTPRAHEHENWCFGLSSLFLSLCLAVLTSARRTGSLRVYCLFAPETAIPTVPLSLEPLRTRGRRR